MTVDDLYKMASKIVYGISSSQRDDIIQDLVFYAWRTMERKKCNASFIKIRMQYCLLNALKLYNNQEKNVPTEGVDNKVFHNDTILSLPMRKNGDDGLSEKQREVTEALIRNNFELSCAAEELGVAVSTISIQWSWARKVLKRYYSEA